MKKILFGILTFLGIGLSFCDASLSCGDNLNCKLFSGTVSELDNTSDINGKGLLWAPTFNTAYVPSNYSTYGTYSYTLSCQLENVVGLNCSRIQWGSYYIANNGGLQDDYTMLRNCAISFTQNNSTFPFVPEIIFKYIVSYSAGYSFDWSCTITVNDSNYSFPSASSCEDKNITVYYNNGNSSQSITCDGVQALEIQGLSTITSTNTFTPYFNIDYKDEDNQSLVESYSKDILYLSGGLFKKTYTGDNERILTDTIESSNSSFTGYVPVFDVTGSIDPNNEFTGNVFNNFADNSLKVLLSNIPSYIQYVILIALLFFILGFIRKFKRR